MTATGKTPPYADCNAVAPETAIAIGRVITDAGSQCIDGGIVGSPPGGTRPPPRFYVSGPGASAMDAFDGEDIIIRQCGPEMGRGSAVKMGYARDYEGHQRPSRRHVDRRRTPRGRGRTV